MHLIASKDSSSMLLWLTKILFEKEFLYVSNSHSLVFARRDWFLERYVQNWEAMPETFYFEAEFWKKMCRCKALKDLSILFTYRKETNALECLSDRTMWPLMLPHKTDSFRFPKFRDVIPETFDGSNNRIALDAKLLVDIQTVFNVAYPCEGLVLQFSEGNRAMSVKPAEQDMNMMEAILMPCRLKD